MWYPSPSGDTPAAPASPRLALAQPDHLTSLVNAHIFPAMGKRVRETVSLYDAKTNLSALVERAARGEEIVIAKSGKPRAALVPLTDVRPLRVAGKGRGKWRVKRGFDMPLPDDLLADFEK